MQREQINELWDRYRAGKASAEDLALLESWYLDFDHAGPELTVREIAERVAAVRLNLPVADKAGSIQKRLWPRYISIAAALAALIFGVWFFIAPDHSDKPSSRTAGRDLTNDIAPGKNTATITLADGKTINLSEAKTGVIIDNNKLTYSDGTALTTAQTQSLTITTPRGGTYQVRLPDGSNVWLNAASSLTYSGPLKERGGVRSVNLSGEAYFEVAKLYTSSQQSVATRDLKRVPFIVKTRNQEVTVLGTHFNVSAYNDENSIKTTLLEGSVKVAPLSASGGEMSERQRGGATILKPSQQAINTGTAIKVNTIDARAEVAWKNGDFVFRNDDFRTLMRKVARWYDVEIIYDKSAPADLPLLGEISRKKNISALLDIMEATGDVHFKIEGRTITVTK